MSGGKLRLDEYTNKKPYFLKSRHKRCHEQLKLDDMKSIHTQKDIRNFWTNTNRLNSRPGIPVTAEGTCSMKGITAMFKKAFLCKISFGSRALCVGGRDAW